MFEVRATYEFDSDADDSFAPDKDIFMAAGRSSDFSGAGVCRDLCGVEHGWHVESFDEASGMRRRLAELPGVVAIMREVTTS